MVKQRIEEIKGTLKRHSFPLEVIVEVTSYCNIDCIMCPQKDLTRERGHMDNSVFNKIADEVAEHSETKRIWPAIMGEPLKDPDILKKMEYASKKCLDIKFNTNALMLTDEIIDGLLNCGIKSFYIGIDAATKDAYDKIRVGGDYDLMVKNTEKLINAAKKYDAKVFAQFIDMEENENEAEAFAKFWTLRGAIAKIRPRLGWGLGVETKGLVIPDSDRDFPCPWLTRTISIHSSGAIVQCDADWDDKDVLGNIKDTTIKEVWDTVLAEKREKHWKLDFDFGNCNKCKDWQAGKSYYHYPDGSKE